MSLFLKLQLWIVMPWTFASPKSKAVIKIILTGLFLALSSYAVADDLLLGTETNLIDTINGTGKKYLYLAEGLASLLIYIKTKNVMALIGILVVAVFFNVMLRMAGVEH